MDFGSIATFALSFLTIALYFLAFRRMFCASSCETLDKIDKLLIICAFAQTFLTFLRTFASFNEIDVLLHSARLFQEILLLLIFGFLLWDERFHAKMSRVFSVFSVILLIFTAIALVFAGTADFCAEILAFSALTLLVSAWNFAATARVFQAIGDFFRHELAESFSQSQEIAEENADGRDFLRKVATEEMKTRRNQVSVLFCGHFLSAIGLFLRDFSEFRSDCVEIPGISQFFCAIVGQFAHVWAVFYVFYWRNRAIAWENAELLVEFRRD